MTSRNFDDFIRRDTEREIAHHERTVAKKQPPPHKPPAPLPTAQFLSQVPDKPLTWLWPGRIPQCMDYPHHGSSKLLMMQGRVELIANSESRLRQVRARLCIHC